MRSTVCDKSQTHQSVQCILTAAGDIGNCIPVAQSVVISFWQQLRTKYRFLVRLPTHEPSPSLSRSLSGSIRSSKGREIRINGVSRRIKHYYYVTSSSLNGRREVRRTVIGRGSFDAALFLDALRRFFLLRNSLLLRGRYSCICCSFIDTPSSSEYLAFDTE